MSCDIEIPVLFVTATDTGVGKTAVAAALAAVLRRRGRNVGVMKPIATGCNLVSGQLVSVDALCLARAAGADDPHDLICPIRLEHPLAPSVAAELEGRTIDLSVIWTAARTLAARHDCLIVEGIGGIMVPVTGDCVVADVAVEFGAPLLVVARAGLGTINHSLLTVGYARSRGLEVAAVVLNSPRGPAKRADGNLQGPAERTNPAVIAKWAGVPVIGPLDHCPGVSVEAGELDGLPARLERLDGVDALIARCLGT